MIAPKAYATQLEALTADQSKAKAKAAEILHDKTTPDAEADDAIKALNAGLPGFHQVAYRSMMEGSDEIYRVRA